MHRSAGKAAKSSNQRHLASQPDVLGLATRLAVDVRLDSRDLRAEVRKTLSFQSGFVWRHG
jgi:hypothetical protein